MPLYNPAVAQRCQRVTYDSSRGEPLSLPARRGPLGGGERLLLIKPKRTFQKILDRLPRHG